MNYYRCIFYHGDAPQGKAYSFWSEDTYTAGEIVEVHGHRKAIVVGKVTKEELDYNADSLKPVIGKWKENEDE